MLPKSTYGSGDYTMCVSQLEMGNTLSLVLVPKSGGWRTVKGEGPKIIENNRDGPVSRGPLMKGGTVK